MSQLIQKVEGSVFSNPRERDQYEAAIRLQTHMLGVPVAKLKRCKQCGRRVRWTCKKTEVPCRYKPDQ